MSADRLPTVSVLVPSYNYARYVATALDSIIEQDYPLELFDVIVINDGSSDGTEGVVAPYVDRFPDQIRLINQENRGLVASLNHAAELARGDLFAIFDADDVWLPHKTRRQVDLFQQNPEMTMVCSNMSIVDADGTATGEELHESRLVEAHLRPETGEFKNLLHWNFGMQSSLIFKHEVFRPAPPEAVYTDWWFMLCAAYAGTVGYVAEPTSLYRLHANNLTAAWRYDKSPQIVVREQRRTLGVKLAALRHFDLGAFTTTELNVAWQAAENSVQAAINDCKTLWVDLVSISDADRATSATHIERADAAAAAGDYRGEADALVKALAWDPYTVGQRARLIDAHERFESAERAPHPLREAQGVVVLADAEELISQPSLLTAYGDAMTGATDLTLAIDASRLSAEDATAALHALIGDAGLSDRDDIDMVAVVGELEPAQHHRMVTTAAARLRPSARTDECALPEFDAESLDALRAFVSQRATTSALAVSAP